MYAHTSSSPIIICCHEKHPPPSPKEKDKCLKSHDDTRAVMMDPCFSHLHTTRQFCNTSLKSRCRDCCPHTSTFTPAPLFQVALLPVHLLADFFSNIFNGVKWKTNIWRRHHRCLRKDRVTRAIWMILQGCNQTLTMVAGGKSDCYPLGCSKWVNSKHKSVAPGFPQGNLPKLPMGRVPRKCFSFTPFLLLLSGLVTKVCHGL